MTFWRELRWLFASHLFEWAFRLIEPEMAPMQAMRFAKLLSELDPDPKFQTVKMGSTK
jgi:hypothetical protein